MHCPRCGERNEKIFDTRLLKSKMIKIRKRQCKACNFKYFTQEEIINEAQYMTIQNLVYLEKKEGTLI